MRPWVDPGQQPGLRRRARHDRVPDARGRARASGGQRLAPRPGVGRRPRVDRRDPVRGDAGDAQPGHRLDRDGQQPDRRCRLSALPRARLRPGLPDPPARGPAPGLSRGATADDMAAIHADRISIPARALVEVASRIEPLDAGSRAALAMLRRWDGSMDRDSAAATVYAAFRTRLVAGRPGRRSSVRSPGTPSLASRARESRTLRASATVWPSGSARTTGRSWRRATTGAARWRGRSRAPSPRYGRRSGRTRHPGPGAGFMSRGRRHPLSSMFPEVADLLDPPAIPAGGDGDTVQAADFIPAAGFELAVTSVARYVFDLGDWERSAWIVPLGVSGTRAARTTQTRRRTGRRSASARCGTAGRASPPRPRATSDSSRRSPLTPVPEGEARASPSPATGSRSRSLTLRAAGVRSATMRRVNRPRQGAGSDGRGPRGDPGRAGRPPDGGPHPRPPRRLLRCALRAAAALGDGVPPDPDPGRRPQDRLHRRDGALADPRRAPRRALGRAAAARGRDRDRGARLPRRRDVGERHASRSWASSSCPASAPESSIPCRHRWSPTPTRPDRGARRSGPTTSRETSARSRCPPTVALAATVVGWRIASGGYALLGLGAAPPSSRSCSAAPRGQRWTCHAEGLSASVPAAGGFGTRADSRRSPRSG